MTGIELPIYAAIGVVSLVFGAGGSYAVTKTKTESLSRDIEGQKTRLNVHEADDDKIHREILRSLGRIEGTLTEMKRASK